MSTPNFFPAAYQPAKGAKHECTKALVDVTGNHAQIVSSADVCRASAIRPIRVRTYVSNFPCQQCSFAPLMLGRCDRTFGPAAECMHLVL